MQVVPRAVLSFHDEKPLITTDHLEFRPVSQTHETFFMKQFSDQTVMACYSQGVIFTPDATKLILDLWYESWKIGPFSAFVILDKSTKTSLGHFAIEATTTPGQAEMELLLPEYTNDQFIEVALAIDVYLRHLIEQSEKIENKLFNTLILRRFDSDAAKRLAKVCKMTLSERNAKRPFYQRVFSDLT